MEPKIDKSKFDLGYFLTPKKQDTYKALKYGLTFCLLLGVGYIIYRGVEALFPKPPEQNIVVKKGGTATITQITANKRFLIPFIEGGVEARDNQDVGAFIRAGARIEF